MSVPSRRASRPAASLALLIAVLIAVLTASLITSAKAFALERPTDEAMRMDQHLGVRLPLEVRLVDEHGRSASLGDLIDDKPTLLLLGYHQCPNVCSAARESLIHALDAAGLAPGRDYGVLAVSIDPQETVADAQHAADLLMGAAASARLAGWHFLTGDEAAIRTLADTVGFHYAFDAAAKQYAHPVAMVLVTPQASIARYFSGLDYRPGELRQTVLAAREGRVGSPITALFLRCFHYDPATGRYSVRVEIAARALGLVSLIALTSLWVVLRRRERATQAMDAT
jgi:protein SCO1/2